MTDHRCAICGTRFTRRRARVVLNRRHIVCVRCMGTREAHALAAPRCAEDWHDGWDHDHQLCLEMTAEQITRSCTEAGR